MLSINDVSLLVQTPISSYGPLPSRLVHSEHSNIRRKGGECSAALVFPAHCGFAGLFIIARITFSSIDDFTAKFIEINGNPSFFYVTDCYRKHYDTQINEIIKSTHKISTFTL